MKRITNNKYIKKNLSHSWLKQNNFRYSQIFSDSDINAYTYRFPIYKYGTSVILECELVMYEDTGEVRIDVYDNNRNKYAPFYYDSKVHDNFITKLDKKIKRKLKELGITKV